MERSEPSHEGDTSAREADANAAGLEPTPAEARTSSGWFRGGLKTSLICGVFAGLAEVCWTYLLPAFNPQWRAELPTGVLALLEFVAAAVATDLLVIGAASLVLLGCCALLTRMHRVMSRLARAAPTLIIWGTLSYLYVGWMVLFILLAKDRGRLSYRLVLVGGVLLLGLGAALARAIGSRLRRSETRRGAILAAGLPLALPALLLTAAFARYRGSIPPAPPPPQTAELSTRPDVLLVTLDTLRVDYLGCYGHPWIQTPTVDALAADGVVFDAAISQAPSTCPSHCTIMTSTYPFDHGAENGKPMRDGLVTLADVFAAHGYETAAFVSSTTTRSISSGLHQGFATYEDSLVPWSSAFGRDELQHLILSYVLGVAQRSQIPGRVVSDRALRWLADHADRPRFVWLHYFDPHSPYGSPPPYRGMYAGRIDDGGPYADERERYAEDITYVDAQLGRVVAALKSAGRYDDMWIIVTSDHGEAFGEIHDYTREVAHGRYLYDTTQHVPLIVKPPASSGERPRRVAEQVELSDIAPTITSLLGMPTPSAWTGVSLKPALAGRPVSAEPRTAHAFNIIDIPAADDPARVDFVQQIALRTPQWKFIAIPRKRHEELYDLRTDPHERTNVKAAHADVLPPLREIVAKFWDSSRAVDDDPRQRLAPALIRQLEALGYMGGQPEPEGDDNGEKDAGDSKPDDRPPSATQKP